MRVIAALAIAAAVLAPAPAARGEEPAPSITVLGSGTVSGRPDMAEITTGVVTQSATAAQALAENTAAMGKVLKAVADLGVADRDVQTTGVSVVPQRAQPPSGGGQRKPAAALDPVRLHSFQQPRPAPQFGQVGDDERLLGLPHQPRRVLFRGKNDHGPGWDGFDRREDEQAHGVARVIVQD